MKKVFVLTWTGCVVGENAPVLMGVSVFADKAAAAKHMAGAALSWVEESEKELAFEICGCGAYVCVSETITYYWGIEEQEVL